MAETFTDTDLEAGIAGSLAKIVERRPLVHAIVNLVAMPLAADAIRAIGALPVMTSAPEEAADMARGAAALLLNCGTPDPRRFEGMRSAGLAANERGIPIVLDPVGLGSTPWRTREIERLLSVVRVSVIRGNHSEMAVLAGREANVQGVEATGSPSLDSLVDISRAVRSLTGAVACISGETDVVAGKQISLIRNGHPTMGQVVGSGCALSAVIAAFSAVGTEVETNAKQAVIIYGLAGEMAARDAQGPGSFRVALVDCLAEIQRERTARGVRMEVLP
ncbi:MAG: hydroxyethylthiazole kinase [Chloroflexi bacterium]|nr:hydroxyethylthiazole kinase [Chloroflexota bacterium]